MMAYVILQPPEKHERRHKQQHAPAGSQHASHLFQSREIVVHVLNHVERRHQIERAVFVRKFLSRAEFYFIETTLATERECIFRNIDALRFAVLRKHQQIRARAAADVENPGPPIRHLTANICNKAGEDVAPADMPPM